MMTWWFIQIIGLLGWIVWLFSYWNKDKKKILFSLLIADFIYVIHYFLLGAISGAVTQFVALLREIAFYKAKNKCQEKWIFIILFPVYVILGMLFCNGIIDTLPIVSSIIVTYTFTMASRYVVLGGIIDSSFWLVYDIVTLSISGVIGDLFMIVSNGLILARERVKNIEKSSKK